MKALRRAVLTPCLLVLFLPFAFFLLVALFFPAVPAHARQEPVRQEPAMNKPQDANGAAAAPQQNAQQPAANPEQQATDAAGFKEFSERVQEFVKLHKSKDAKLPKLKSKDEPEMIMAHQHALARKIREARPHAKRGDIFTPHATEAFRHAVGSALKGPQSSNAQATMKQGAPLKDVPLRVNHAYPEAVPYTTVPPTLLLALPKLPDELAYRVAGHDLVLLDVKANLVVDLIAQIIP